MITAFQFAILIAIILFSYTIGWLFTIKIHLPKYSSFFDFKAFSCQKCMTTHINWILSTFISLLLHAYCMLGVGIFLSGGLFLLLYWDEKERFIEE